MHGDGQLRNPETCGCAYNVYWKDGFRDNYAHLFHDCSFVHAFVQELAARWPIPSPTAYVISRMKRFIVTALPRLLQNG
jgi:hypothetical protein